MAKQINLDLLLEKYSQENLRRISADLIDSYRIQDRETLYHYAKRLQINTGEYHSRLSILFRKLIFTYHPDRYILFHKKIRELYGKGDISSLERLAVDKDERGSRYQVPSGKEHYSPAWMENDTDSDLEDYLEGAWTGVHEEEEYGFIEAVRNMMYGNLFTEFLPKDLFYLEGELNLADEGIEDLKGIEYCRNITELNLENNRIVHVGGIADLGHLTALNLSHNLIEDIDDLAELKELRVLDLSFNDIEDARILNDLTRLEYVNLIGNRVSEEQLTGLKERCIVLI